MGGLGSGNYWQSGRATCEASTRIELPYLRKRGMLRPGYRGSLSWNVGGSPSGSISFHMHQSGMELIYKYRKAGEDEWRDVSETIPFAFTGQHLGGRRRWFVCLSCGRRCGVLYGGTHYRCRKCWNLAYASQSESPSSRAISKAQKLRRRLGGSESLDDAFPKRPKGMHRRTYQRLRAKGEALDMQADAMLAGYMAIFLGRR